MAPPIGDHTKVQETDIMSVIPLRVSLDLPVFQREEATRLTWFSPCHLLDSPRHPLKFRFLTPGIVYSGELVKSFFKALVETS